MSCKRRHAVVHLGSADICMTLPFATSVQHMTPSTGPGWSGQGVSGIHFEQQLKAVQGAASREAVTSSVARSRRGRFDGLPVPMTERSWAAVRAAIWEASFCRCRSPPWRTSGAIVVGTGLRPPESHVDQLRPSPSFLTDHCQKLLQPCRQQLQLRQLPKLLLGPGASCQKPLAGAAL